MNGKTGTLTCERASLLGASAVVTGPSGSSDSQALQTSFSALVARRSGLFGIVWASDSTVVLLESFRVFHGVRPAMRDGAVAVFEADLGTVGSERWVDDTVLEDPLHSDFWMGFERCELTVGVERRWGDRPSVRSWHRRRRFVDASLRGARGVSHVRLCAAECSVSDNDEPDSPRCLARARPCCWGCGSGLGVIPVDTPKSDSSGPARRLVVNTGFPIRTAKWCNDPMDHSAHQLERILALANERSASTLRSVTPTASGVAIEHALSCLPRQLPDIGLGTERALDTICNEFIPALAHGQAGPRYFRSVSIFVLGPDGSSIDISDL